jgi:type IV pilus assembly protein PilB
MARAESSRERIGDMLVAAELITVAELDEALAAQVQTRLPIGKQLVSMGYVSEVQLTQLLSHQLSVPWVSLERVEFSATLLAKVPAELADRFTIMPIYVRSVRHQGATLYIAMDDPTQEEALRRVSIASNLPVKPMIASPSDIRRAIDLHYFGGVPDEEEIESEELPDEPRHAGEPDVSAAKAARPKPPPPPARLSRPNQPEGEVPVDLYETPSSPPQAEAPARTLTFLDGTTVAVPKRQNRRVAREISEVRHVVKAVRRANADMGVEGSPRWHDIVQVLLDTLQAKGVKLTRREIQEAWLRAKQPNSGESK